ncbi:hypothetical protein D3W54_12405 [Komagataeibacter medellinensis]|uniref:Uncharacterized protein n=1 Tax=Komagataeibacter medellinensis TaxID=1177712 RepID=A0ABQ6VXE0_9PROT|nr:hypothetical protein D3W54_12405 [Komagataeibacter medellinensis]
MPRVAPWYDPDGSIRGLPSALYGWHEGRQPCVVGQWPAGPERARGGGENGCGRLSGGCCGLQPPLCSPCRFCCFMPLHPLKS